MTITLTVPDVGRTTVRLEWTRDWDPAGPPSSYLITRATPPAGPVIVARIPGRVFIDPDCRPNITYQYTVAAIGVAVPDTQAIQVTTRPPTEFPDSVTFFHDYLSKVFARDTQTEAMRWCPEPWRHKEMRVVVNELWRSYEAHRPPDDPTTPTTERAVWLAVYAYPLLERLWNPEGTFRGCSHRHGQATHTSLEAPPLAG